MVATLRTLVAAGILRGKNLTDVIFSTTQAPPSVKLSSFKQSGDNFETALTRISTPRTIVDLETTTQFFANFDQGDTCALYTPNVRGYTNGVLKMTPGSSTHAAAVNAQTSGTVQESYLRLGAGPSDTSFAGYFSADMIGTAQGHIYNGLKLYWNTNAVVEYSNFIGIPGSSSAPPGETTPLNNFSSVNTTVRNTVVDGTDAGAGSSATGMLNSSCTGVLIQNSVFKNMVTGHGWAAYQTSNATLESTTFANNAKAGVNFEKCTGTITIRNCTFTGNQHDLIVDTDGTSAIVNIYDPVWDGMNTGTKFKVLIHTTYNYPPPAVSPNKQKASDIHLFQNGVEVTSSKLQIVSS